MFSHLKFKKNFFLLQYYWNFQLNHINTLISPFILYIQFIRNLNLWSHKKIVFPPWFKSTRKDLPLIRVFWYFYFRSDTLADGSAPRMLYQSFLGICSNAIIHWTRSGPSQISWIKILMTIHYNLQDRRNMQVLS